MGDLFSIPEISKKELLSRYKRIKPIIEVNDIKYFLRRFSDDELRCLSYIWYKDKDKEKLVDVNQYSSHKDISCLHGYGHYALFKPSIAEVLAQISADDAKSVCAFEIIDYPKCAADFNKHKAELNAGYHVSTVRLYSLEPCSL